MDAPEGTADRRIYVSYRPVGGEHVAVAGALSRFCSRCGLRAGTPKGRSTSRRRPVSRPGSLLGENDDVALLAVRRGPGSPS
ncbi:hypothetical protein [Streptomyces sp. NPDC058739]|uniref:hypothetical protein n=1 Tax=Streptomyces sp. NPDC058739 TaxID=3346618 RepID=UPI00369D9C4A